MEFIGFILFAVAAAIIGLPIAALVVARTTARRLGEEILVLSDKLRDLQAEVARLNRQVSAPAAQAPSQAVTPVPAQAAPASPPRQVAPTPTFAPSPTPMAAQPPPAAAPAPPQPTAPGAQAPTPQPTPPPLPSRPVSLPAQESIAAFHPTPVPPPRFLQDSSGSSRAEKVFSLEERLGANWLNKIGIAILVVGLAFFLAYKLQTMGPAGKVLCGFAISAALLLGGVWLERKAPYRIFARAGIGGGWALAFFTTFALHHIEATRILPSLGADLVLMLLVAAGMVAHSLRYRSQTVTGLAFLLGFLTLLTSHLQSADGTVVFSLSGSAVLAIALVIVTTRRHYAILEVAGLIAVYITHFAWLTQVLPDDRAAFTQFWPSTALILGYWLIFRLAYVLRTPLNQQEENLSSLTAVLNSAGVLGLLKYQSAHPEWAFWALAALGAIEMGLAFFVRGRRRQAFVVLSTIASVLLVAAVPFKFHGVTWPVLWLVEAQALAICGLRLGEPVFRRLGLLTGILTGAVIAADNVAPLAWYRLDHLDPARHLSLTVSLVLAAALYWIHAELYPRRWPQIAENELEAFALMGISWLGLSAAAAALWVVLPSAWVVVGWLALVFAVGIVADRLQAVSLALQSDALTLAACAGLFFWNLSFWNASSGSGSNGQAWVEHRLPLAASVLLLYAGMRRKTVAEGFAAYVPVLYSWLATLLLAFAALDQSSIVLLGPVWAVLGLALFETGRSTRKAFLRWQGFFLVALAFGRYLLCDLPDSFSSFAQLLQTHPGGHFSFTNSLLLEVLVVAAAGYWLAERARLGDPHGDQEQIGGLVAGSLSTFSLAVWFAYRFPSDWVPVPGGALWVASIWAAMATIFVAIACLIRRRALLAQAVVLAISAAVRSICFDLSWTSLTSTSLSSSAAFWSGPLFHVSIAALLLLAALPFAFQMRNRQVPAPDGFRFLLTRTEQWFFFTPFALMVIALAAELSSAHITIAWSLMGLAVFLFALAVGERSYRLAGLGLLLVSVVKILLMDVWALAPSDRYTTLIILGLALLAVSFLYTRFGAVIRRYL
jgi:hypothetical protein